MNEFKQMSGAALPFPLQHALTQTVAGPAAAQETAELMTLWTGQSASLCLYTEAIVFMTQLIEQADAILQRLSGVSSDRGALVV